MGRVIHDHTTAIEFDDRVLSHLQIVTGTELRRSEAFYFPWADDPSMGDGRNVIWLHPSTPLRFRYDGSRRPAINRAWIEALLSTANSRDGLRVMPHPPRARPGQRLRARARGARMNRVQVSYGGRDYVIGNRSRADVEGQIAAGVESGRSAWLDVAYGAGTPVPCRLLLTPGVPIAVVEFPEQPGD